MPRPNVHVLRLIPKPTRSHSPPPMFWLLCVWFTLLSSLFTFIAVLCLYIDLVTTFYHVTPEVNLEGIARNGLQPNSSGEGISGLRKDQFFMEDSKGKVFMTSQWFTAKRYVEHFQGLLEKKEKKDGTIDPRAFPAVLKIELRLSEQKGVIFKDETDKPPDGKDGKPIPVPGGSYFMTTGIPPSKISVALHLYPTTEQVWKSYEANPIWQWTAITTLKFHDNQVYGRMLPVIPDLPKEGMNTNMVFPTALEVIAPLLDKK